MNCSSSYNKCICNLIHSLFTFFALFTFLIKIVCLYSIWHLLFSLFFFSFFLFFFLLFLAFFCFFCFFLCRFLDVFILLSFSLLFRFSMNSCNFVNSARDTLHSNDIFSGLWLWWFKSNEQEHIWLFFHLISTKVNTKAKIKAKIWICMFMASLCLISSVFLL